MLNQKQQIEDRIKQLKESETKEYLIKKEEDILRGHFISEIEKLKSHLKINNEDIATKANVTSSYISQVFNGKKPLNFNTLAKISLAYDLRFDVRLSKMNRVKTFVFNFFNSTNETVVINTNDFYELNVDDKSKTVITIGSDDISYATT